MQFRYDTRYTGDEFEMVPRVPIIFSNPANGLEIPVFCLVDSGATESLSGNKAFIREDLRSYAWQG